MYLGLLLKVSERHNLSVISEGVFKKPTQGDKFSLNGIGFDSDLVLFESSEVLSVSDSGNTFSFKTILNEEYRLYIEKDYVESNRDIVLGSLS